MSFYIDSCFSQIISTDKNGENMFMIIHFAILLGTLKILDFKMISYNKY